MVLDFRSLKGEVEAIVDRLDHKFLNEVPPFDVINPTAENISKYMYEQISGGIDTPGVKVLKVKVWESEKAAATYYE